MAKMCILGFSASHEDDTAQQDEWCKKFVTELGVSQASAPAVAAHPSYVPCLRWGFWELDSSPRAKTSAASARGMILNFTCWGLGEHGHPSRHWCTLTYFPCYLASGIFYCSVFEHQKVCYTAPLVLSLLTSPSCVFQNCEMVGNSRRA